MNDQAVKHILENTFPALPQAVDSRIRETLAGASPEAIPRLRRAFPRFALAALLVLLFGVTAVAALQNMGVLHFTQSYMNEAVYATLPEASGLVKKNLAEIDRPTVTVRVEEAAYDGRVLQIMYSITRKDATTPFDKQAAENGDYAYDTKANGSFGACDWLEINGQKVNLVMIATSAGEENGQLLYYVESSLEPFDSAAQLRPTGKMTVGLPIEWKETGAAVPEGLTFAMDIGDTAAYDVRLPEPIEARGCLVQFTDLHFSPIQVSIMYTVIFPKAMADGKTDEELDALIRGFAHGRLENEQGTRLGTGKEGTYHSGPNVLENGGLEVEVYDRYTPSAAYTPVVYLVTEGGDRLPIPMEPAGKP